MRWVLRAASGLALAAAGASPASGQVRPDVPTRWVPAGSEVEDYFRYLQTLALIPAYPWSVRGFAPSELRTLAPRGAHPWAGTRRLEDRPRALGPLVVDAAPLDATMWYNSAFPFGMNDGAVWVGRGLTAQGSLGVAARWRWVEVTLAPTAFWAENRPFATLGNPANPFRDPASPEFVDRPQRFGGRSYGRVDAGQSSLRVEALGTSFGISNANEWWGPMTDFPFLLGNNAPGFGHVFFGSARPMNVFVGRLHARVLYASLEQSAFGPVPADTGGRRFAGGLVAAFQPRGFPGLEVGLTRFYHVAWPDSGLTGKYFTHLFEGFLKERVGSVLAPQPGNPGNSRDNQLASAFARWVLPHSGFELYGEYGREDHNSDAQDFVLEPDHSSAYGIGLRKAWLQGTALTAVRAEVMSFQISSLDRHRAQGGYYGNVFVRQGHTQRGQLLGAGIGVGSGAGSSVALDRLDTGGKLTASWMRLVVRDRPGDIRGTDVQHVLRIERVRHLRRDVDVRWAVDGVYEMNRNSAGDKFNARAQVASAWYP